MAPLILAIVLFALLVAVGVAFSWQERRTHSDHLVVYSVEEALDYVWTRLSDSSRARVDQHDVRRILEWELRYLQDPAIRGSRAAVVGGLSAAQYAQEQAMAQGHAYDGAVIIEVLDLQAGYLAALGAIGEPVSGDEIDDVLGGHDDAEEG